MATPPLGTVYGIFSHRYQKWGLVQLTHDNGSEWGFYTLEYFEPELPHPEQLPSVQKMQLAPSPHHRATEDLGILISRKLPKHLREVGIAPVVSEKEPRGYGALTCSMEYQHSVRQLPAAARAAKEAALATATRHGNQNATIKLRGTQYPLSTTTIQGELLDLSAEELSALPCLDRIVVDRRVDHLQEILDTLPLLRTVDLEVDPGPVKLPIHVDTLHLGTSISKDISLSSAAPWLQLSASALVDLPNVTDIRLSFSELDIGDLLQRYPHVVELWLKGAPAQVSHIEALTELSHLRLLSMEDCFGFDSLPFLEGLETLYLSSVPAAAGKQARKDYHHIDHEIRQLRNPEWIAENLSNPFRSWADSEHENARYATRAFKAWKAHRRALLAAVELPLDQVQHIAHEELCTVAAEFNSWYAKTEWIETVEREDIFLAYEALLEELNQRRVALGKAPIDQNSAFAGFASTRAW